MTTPQLIETYKRRQRQRVNRDGSWSLGNGCLGLVAFFIVAAALLFIAITGGI